MILNVSICDLKGFGTKIIRRRRTVSVPQKLSRFRFGLGHRPNRGKFSGSDFYEISYTSFKIYFNAKNKFVADFDLVWWVKLEESEVEKVNIRVSV